MSILQQPPAMQGHTTSSASPVPSPHSIDYSQPAIATGRITTYEFPPTGTPGEEESEAGIAMQYYTTVQPPSVGSSSSTSRESLSAASPGSDSVASGPAVHVAVLQNPSMSPDESPNICVPLANSHSDNGSSSSVKHWTYEEQFKQLYNMSPEPERKFFLDKLFDFMQRKGTPITRIPIMAKQPLDLYRLFKLVVERGGLVEVIKKKAWRNVAKELNLPASITSAAFTMRSQYVKYLYPYECEVEKLSEPQELQLAIDSNKRDRRHSETVEFIAPQLTTCRPPELDQDSLSPIAHINTPKGFQLIGSPTVALPHGSIPPYSGGFIVTPSGTHVMTSPGSSRGQPQLLHMTPQGIPIVMPTSIANELSEAGSNDDVDNSFDCPEPPAKKLALDPKVAIASSPLLAGIPPHTASFLVAPPGGGQLVQVPQGLTSQLIQMSPQPFIVPATVGSSSPTEGWSHRDERLRMIQQTASMKRDVHPSDNGISIAAISPQALSGMVIASGPRSGHLASPRLLPISATSQRPSSFPITKSIAQGIVSNTHVVTTDKKRFEQLVTPLEKKVCEEELKLATEKPPSSHRVSFANISIQSADKDSGEKVNDSSLLVTLELNNTVYQGVLFAKPSASSSLPLR